MNRLTISIFLCVWLLSSLGSAGETPRVTFNHPLRFFADQSLQTHPTKVSSFPETLHVLCAMVAFQEDTDERTSGTGNFDLSDTGYGVIDPPPHNKAYFDQHLLFAHNYFRKASNGKLIVIGDMLDSVYRLPKAMQEYSPSRLGTDNIKLGYLAQDAWHVVDSITPGIPFQNYKAFILFHAGVGRDLAVDVQELDPTPFDIPSIYLGPASLRQMFGASYQGVPVADSSVYISNTIIMPETESRVQSSIIGSYLIQLGINGLLVASIGSYLELPDLFDTKTGRTGIGRFGLMDGQSIFSWNGIFPPEPSAWEKIWLGWVTPITVSSGDSTYQLPAVSLSNSPDTIYKVPITTNEYFLVENRNRDANRDGTTITTIVRGDTLRKTWYRDTTHFNAFSTDSIYGNVIDVDEFDWSLPGGIDAKTDSLLDGGALIWHIDENVINANLATNGVNADQEHRGVDLEEADGSQDLGQLYDFTQAGYRSMYGWAFDFWYAGNSAPVRSHANYFSPTSFPNSMSYEGANSHIYIKNFTSRSPRMTVTIQVGDTTIQSLPGFPKRYVPYSNKTGITVAPAILAGGPIIFVPGEFIYGWDKNGSTLNGFKDDGQLATIKVFGASRGFTTKPVLLNTINDTVRFSAIGKARYINDFALTSILQSWQITDNDHDSLVDPNTTTDLFPGSNSRINSLVLSDTFYAVGAQANTVLIVSTGGNILGTYQLNTSDTTDIVGLSLWAKPDTFIAVSAGGTIGMVTSTGVIRTKNVATPCASAAIAGMFSASSGKGIILATQDGNIHLLDQNFNDWRSFPVATGGEIMNAPALSDIDGDGQRDIIVFSGNKIWAMNSAGAVLDNFPVRVSTQKTILTSPVVGDMDGNGTQDIVAVTQEGLVVAYDRTGSMVRGFPLQTGPNSGMTPAIFLQWSPYDCFDVCPPPIGLMVASDDSTVYAWITSPTGSLTWSQYMFDEQNSGLVEYTTTIQPRSNDFLPTTLAYNWPNPVGIKDGYKTHIRYYVSENASVEIKILDLAGDLVTTLTGQGTGGLDNEIEWDVSNIQSGVYFAHLEAHSATKSGVAIIKIAVVK